MAERVSGRGLQWPVIALLMAALSTAARRTVCRAAWARALTWAFALCCVAPSARVRAEPAPASDAAKPEYTQLVQQALHEYEIGNFNEAKVFFARAHALSPNARTLRGIGMCAYELRNYVESIGYFEQALSSKQRPLTVPMNGEVTRLLSQARSFVTKLTLQLQPSQARLRIDARPVTPTADGSVLLDPGVHELTIEAQEYDSDTRTIRTNGAEVLSLDVTLQRTRSESPELHHATAEPEELPSEASPVPEGAAAAMPSHASSGAGSSQVGPWLLIGAGAAVAIAGGVLLAVALDYKHIVENPTRTGRAREEAPRYSEYKGKYDLVYPLSFAGVAALSVGLASVAGGVIWKVATGGRQERPSTEVQVGLGHITLRRLF